MATREIGKKTELLPQKSKLSDQVLDCLMDWIMDGTLQMGDKLRTEKISNALGVSRMPVREALNALERKGIAVSEPYVGMRLIHLDKDEIKEIYRLRQLLEPEAGYHACLHITSERLEEVKEIHQEYQEILLSPSFNAKDIHLKNREFHFAIYAASGLKRTCHMIEELWDASSFFKMLYGETLLTTPEGKQQMIAEHQAYIDYLERGDAEAFRNATQEKIGNKWKRYEKSIESNEMEDFTYDENSNGLRPKRRGI
ncbi:MAG: GntR family transcriptional regulator [Clostridiales bacterium]|nr:GntR family transcriptional regulator [Clostridiales bacterium]